MELLESGVLTASRTIALVTELEAVPDDLARQIDAELAHVLALLPVWRIEQEVRRLVLRLDPEAAAARAAAKNADRAVQLTPDADDQALVALTGPAVPLTRWYATLDARARALKASGDPRTLDALRFDLATSTFPCDTHPPADATRQEGTRTDAATDAPGDRDVPADSVARPAVDQAADPSGGSTGLGGAAGLRPSFVEAASLDCRRSRPVQAHVIVPVETALGLSNEPAWLDGYGWISAPTCRLLLIDAELRQVCAKAGTGEIVDLPAGAHRPPPTPTGLRDSLLDLVLRDVELSDVGWRSEPQHDPTDRLREYVTLRDRTCDGPTGARVSASRSHLDHDRRWPDGPTAAWNLTARSNRTHQHKHAGWTPLRTATGTLWISPAGQLVQVPRHTQPPPGIDPGPPGGAGASPCLPEPDELAHLDCTQLTASTDDRPVLPIAERDETRWTWLDGSQQVEDAVPF
jgi:hypothetical protein